MQIGMTHSIQMELLCWLTGAVVQLSQQICVCNVGSMKQVPESYQGYWHLVDVFEGSGRRKDMAKVFNLIYTNGAITTM